MEACTVETGLLRKAPCGQTAVAKCANCEQPLCSKHAIAQLSAAGKKTGAFMCAECEKAHRQHERLAATRSAPAPARPAAPAPKPAAAAAKPAAAPAAAAPADAAPPKPAAAKPAENSDGSIEFTPTKK